MILERLNHWAREAPARTALIHNDRRFSFADLARNIEATRRSLAPRAPVAGVALILARSCLNAWVLGSAARALGLTTVVAPTIERGRELGLKDVTCVIAASDEQGLLQPPGDWPAVPRLAAPASATGQADGLGATISGVEIGAETGGHILYTSGTTSSFKKLLFDAAGEDARAMVRAATDGFSQQTVFHALDFGLWTGIGFKAPIAVWSKGGCVVIDQTPALYANFRRHEPTHANSLSENLKAIVEAADPTSPPSSHMLLRTGGGFTPLALATQVVARISTTLVIGFAASELPTVVMQSGFQSAEDLFWLSPTDPSSTQVVDEDGAEAPDCVEGLLRFQLSEADTNAYLDDPDATARAFRDGCFYSGDLAVRRADGRIRVLGRSADVINIRGQKMAVAPVEQSIQQGLGVDEVCLFLGLANDGVEELVVAVRSRRPLDPAEVLDRLGPSKIFDRVRVELFADFPRTTTGTAKTKRTELRRMVFPNESLI